MRFKGIAMGLGTIKSTIFYASTPEEVKRRSNAKI